MVVTAIPIQVFNMYPRKPTSKEGLGYNLMDKSVIRLPLFTEGYSLIAVAIDAGAEVVVKAHIPNITIITYGIIRKTRNLRPCFWDEHLDDRVEQLV